MIQRTKIVATLGPASDSKTMLKNLVSAGVNVFRMNFSHATQSYHAENIKKVRELAHKEKCAIGIIADLQGPKIRLGLLKNGMLILKRGATVSLTIKKVEGSQELLPVDFAELPAVVRSGMIILLSEGAVRLRVKETHSDYVVCDVARGGVIKERQGVNIVGLERTQAMTEKDKNDIRFAIEQGVDYFALSFIRSAQDVRIFKEYIARYKGNQQVIAKIEKPEAVRALKEILVEVDGVMVARGDLGVEGNLEDIPIWQKRIIRKSIAADKVVITATQMLESMITQPLPTRAEVTDVANAIFDGTSAVMLSGETAVGKYPKKTVAAMRRVIHSAENSREIEYYTKKFVGDNSIECAIAHGAIDAAQKAHIKAIIVFTMSGSTAAMITKQRPRVPIIALTPNEKTYNQMSLLWGVTPVMTELGASTSHVIASGEKEILRKKLLKKGDTAIFVFGKIKELGGTNQIKIMQIGA